MTIVLNAAGGLGIFLLAMAMMTDGLKVFGGDNLRRVLERWASGPIRAALSGAMITALVQSSSAVTVATIGFVNAGILGLQQSLGVIFGANVGTTMTGWLVTAVGFDFKIEAFALPIIALGVALRLAAPRKRWRGLGGAIAGFGLFFLGLGILKEAFGGLAESFGTMTLQETGGIGGVVLFALIGFLATVLAQSSSAAIALILTAASASTLGLGAAAAAIIGANVGTTSTALLAVIGATPNARRVAAGHIAFNLCTGLIALLILPGLLWFTRFVGTSVGLADQPVVVLALFHTVFNVLGVVLLLPFVGRMAAILERLFKTPEEDIGRSQFLDKTVAATPDFALPALRQELSRMLGLICETGFSALEGAVDRGATIKRRAKAIRRLGDTVRDFTVTVHMEALSRDQAEALPRHLRIARYFDEAAHNLKALRALHRRAASATGPLRESLDALTGAARRALHACAEEVPEGESPAAAAAAFEAAYQTAKVALLDAAARHESPVEVIDGLLDATSDTRRLLDQLVKGTTMLRAEAHGTPAAVPEDDLEADAEADLGDVGVLPDPSTDAEQAVR